MTDLARLGRSTLTRLSRLENERRWLWSRQERHAEKFGPCVSHFKSIHRNVAARVNKIALTPGLASRHASVHLIEVDRALKWQVLLGPIIISQQDMISLNH